MPGPSILSAEQRAFVAAARTAILATTAPGGRPRLVPICFVLHDDLILSQLDEKPKQVGDPRDLARVRDVRTEPTVALLVHHWDEEWSRLGWVRLLGTATLLEPVEGEHEAGVVALRSKYAQYRSQAIDERPMLRIALDRVTSWGALGDEP